MIREYARAALGLCIVGLPLERIGAQEAPVAVQPPGQPAPPPRDTPRPGDAPPEPEPGPAPAIVSRADLSRHVNRVHRLFMPLIGDGPRRVAPGKIAELNRGFDSATVAYFTSNFPAAIAKLDELAQQMLTTGGGEVLPTTGAPISVVVEPPVWWEGSPATPRVRVSSFTPSAVDQTVTFAFDWDDGRASPAGHPRLEKRFDLRKGLAVWLEIPLSEFGAWPEGGSHWAVGTYSVKVTVGGFREFAESRYCVVPSSLDAARIKNLKALDAARESHPDLADQIALCQARSRVLVDYPGTLEPAEYFADYPRLAAEVESEVAAISEGRNPYAGRAGEIYRPIIGKGTPDNKPVPCVVYAPSVVADGTPRPVVVALHGAGGDESSFIRSYGGGRLVQLAEQRGFILASPQSYKLGGRAGVMSLLLDGLARDYSVDRSRVYIIGHSLGAGAATYFASAMPDTVAGAVCFSGLGRPGPRTAPMLVYMGALDTIGRPESVRATFEEARARKLPIELREVPDYGHSLIVGAKLDDAVGWLFEKSLEPAPKK